MLTAATQFLLDHNLYILTGCITVVFLVETVLVIRAGRSLDRVETSKSITAAVAYLFGKVIGTKLSIFALYIWVWRNFAIFDVPVFAWWSWAILWVAGDFAYYWIHRAEHQTRLLWAAHSIHHSSTEFNYTTAIRMPWMEMFYKPAVMLWAPLAGFNPVMFAALGAVALILGQLQHSENVGPLGVLDKIFVTPVNHRAHHASNPEYLDKNFGASFIIWDRLFGTYEPFADSVDIRYGLVPEQGTGEVADVLVGGFPALAEDLRSGEITPRELLTMG